ncbi:hypothetical protein O6H91_18G084600 [Diphasiastrum complanatum]|uniref:Uncharacterized protein n=1 Tax=Diphasiastrum complanatum TaxID=34168 RepID=A0ACC2B4H5_DIPCM|nr:hypothetical protein O6H91_18G084600 [Diphasiastrum complanatum]
MFLEDEGRFGEAENEFIKGGKPREAIDMYIHQQDWQAAVKVADLCEPAAVTDIQLAQAELFLKQNELEKAEALFLLAKKTEFALNMYKEYNRWEDAIRIAKDHMPSLIPELNQDFASFMKSQNGGIETFDGIMAQAQAMEQAQDYLEAINLYLHLDVRHTDDNSKLHEVWMKAINVAKHYAHIRLPEVVHVVAKRFIAEGIYEEAANLYEDINASKEIIEMCIKAGQWDRARQAAAKGDVQQQQHVDKLFKQHLLKTQDAGQLVQTGYIAEALELYAQGGVWDKVHELAGLLGPDKQKEVSLRHAKLCLDSQKNVEAIAILACYGAPSTRAACELCCFLMKDLLGSSQKYSDIGHGIQELRTVLFELGKPNAEFHTAIFSTEWLELKELCLIATYICSCLHAQSQGLQEIVAKLFISLLRYCRIVPSDKAFYEAGIACKQLGWQGMAFVYLNCYLDIAEAIDSPDHGTLLDVSGLEMSDIPQNIPVPEQHFISEESREEVRDWIIQLSLDQQVEPTLPSRSCERCGKAVDAASIICFSCKYQNEACCVTGYPVLPHKRVTCKLCDMPANKKDWNSFTQSFERCPWCHKSQQPEY